MRINSINNPGLSAPSAKCSPNRRNPLLLSLIALIFIWYGTVACAVRADTAPSYQVGHIYVYYSPDNTPSASGNLVDVTDTLSYTGEHVYDIYGHLLVIDNTNHTVSDASGTVVGFVCYQSD